MSANVFTYEKAFSRNLGWITPEEQKKIAKVKVGIVGMGGVGGQYAEILTRLGVQQFYLCDEDEFAVENSNRQNGCQIENYGRKKVEVIKERILAINPNANVKTQDTFLKVDQVEAFCGEIDFYFDCIDFFELDVRAKLFECMQKLKKTAITAAPIGTGSSSVVFDQSSMTFENYFGLNSTTVETHRNILFLIGLAPSLQHLRYLIDTKYSDFKNRKAPSLPLGVYSCAAAAGTIFLKLVIGRGKVLKAPWSTHYDPFNSCLKETYLLFGNRSPLQILKFKIIKWKLNL